MQHMYQRRGPGWRSRAAQPHLAWRNSSPPSQAATPLGRGRPKPAQARPAPPGPAPLGPARPGLGPAWPRPARVQRERNTARLGRPIAAWSGPKRPGRAGPAWFGGKAWWRHKRYNLSENVKLEYQKPKLRFRCLRKKRPSSRKRLNLEAPPPPISMLWRPCDRVDWAAKKTSIFVPRILLNGWQH